MSKSNNKILLSIFIVAIMVMSGIKSSVGTFAITLFVLFQSGMRG